MDYANMGGGPHPMAFKEPKDVEWDKPSVLGYIGIAFISLLFTAGAWGVIYLIGRSIFTARGI